MKWILYFITILVKAFHIMKRFEEDNYLETTFHMYLWYVDLLGIFTGTVVSCKPWNKPVFVPGLETVIPISHFPLIAVSYAPSSTRIVSCLRTSRFIWLYGHQESYICCCSPAVEDLDISRVERASFLHISLRRFSFYLLLATFSQFSAYSIVVSERCGKLAWLNSNLRSNCVSFQFLALSKTVSPRKYNEIHQPKWRKRVEECMMMLSIYPLLDLNVWTTLVI